MQNSQAQRLFGRNIFTDAFRQFDEDGFFESLHNQVRNKSYFEKYKGFKLTVAILSYVFNVASALTAFYAAYWLTEKITGIPLLSWIVAAIFLFFLEKIKRRSSTEVWKSWFFDRSIPLGWLALSLVCLGLSLASSGFGAKEGTEDLGPGAELLATDSTAQAYQARIDSLAADNERLSEQKNAAGEIYWPAQQEKKANKEMIAALQLRILALDQKLEGKNELLSAEYQDDIKVTAATMIWITIAMEFLFEICIAYIWYFFYRCYVERRQTGQLNVANPPSPAPSQLQQEQASPPQIVQIDPAVIAQIVAQELERQRQSISVHTSPSSNGHDEPSSDQSVQNIMPARIGYFTEAQRREQETPLDPSVQVRTDVYTEEIEVDKFTVMHEYVRHGIIQKTPYTRNQIQSRIYQYERAVGEAVDRNLPETTVQNRQKWLTYWQGKMSELEQKIASVQNSKA